VLSGRETAIFVHGCFWHGHDCARGARVPKQNRDYWIAKIGKNRARDMANQAALKALGWTPLIVWECELKDAAALEARLAAALGLRR
jgi:DNA mismatch endonuclease (patch repair protein)